jgi:peptidoglycan hydrolase-like protein with peptidoglycan-binding domain
VSDGDGGGAACGGLDPTDDMQGARQRLRNLGYDCGEDDEQLQAAIGSFQLENQLPVTKQLDEATRDTLRKIHGCRHPRRQCGQLLEVGTSTGEAMGVQAGRLPVDILGLGLERMAKEMESTQQTTGPSGSAQGAAVGPVGSGNYEVQQGDCLSSIAYAHGFFWETLWNHSANQQLKSERKDPNVLLAGDRVFVPDLRPKQESGTTGRRHRFKRKGVPEKLIVQFLRQGKPKAHEAYILDIDGVLSEGKTDKDGKVRISIPPDAKTGKISFRNSVDQYQLDLGHLDPVTEISGVQGRLANLGFYSGPLDGKMSEELTRAIRDFQAARDPQKEPTGALDEKTREQIQDAYGG